ncbi:hypothetical protein KEM54_004139 [Ascosphaera aggregata]|nr:hypothetical protein KEM54_004139 [Ascosphaera aggregata]
MSQSTDANHFFQTSSNVDTSSALEESTRKEAKAENNHGDPIRLKSKLLALHLDPRSKKYVYVAASTAIVQRVNLETGAVDATYTGPSAPVTSIAFSLSGDVLFAGCWDKCIWSWDVTTRKVLHKFEGHADFVKSVICTVVDKKEVLVSSGSDAQVMVWDVETKKKVDVIKGLHVKGIHDLALDPETVNVDKEPYPILFTAGSDRTIQHVKLGPRAEDSALNLAPITQHATSVFGLHFDADGDLWTASADKTAKCLSRQRNWASELTLEHPDFVRDIIVYEEGGWVVTACRDEEIRVWNKATGELYHTYSGHFEEVTGLVLLDETVISVSIDGTVRKWSLNKACLQKAKEEAANPPPPPPPPSSETKTENALTEEEEKELAELMDDLGD